MDCRECKHSRLESSLITKAKGCCTCVCEIKKKHEEIVGMYDFVNDKYYSNIKSSCKDFKQNRNKETCPLCGKQFISIKKEQVPGCEMSSILRCPHCKKVVRQSLIWKYLREEKK